MNREVKGIFSFMLKKNKDVKKGLFQPIGKIHMVDNTPTFFTSKEAKTGGEVVYLTEELSHLLNEGEFRFSGKMKRTEKGIWVFSPYNYKQFLTIFK